jgi:uncharacterized protein YbjQ (UPF0145 family)
MWSSGDPGVIVTTTSSLEGWRIEAYLGPVTVHLVAGTNLFSDFFASMSDVFGGRSQSYGRQLAALYQEATQMLVAEARKRGATAVVGFGIDFDELSGQGKSMFMLNAVGTAVRAVPVRVDAAARQDAAAAVLPADEMSVLLRKGEIMRQVAARKLRLDRETWDFITRHRIAETAGFVLGAFLDAGHYPEEQKPVEDRARVYFARLTPEQARRPLYNALAHTQHQHAGQLHRLALSLIHELRLLDYGEVARLLANPDRDVRIRAVAALGADRQVYEPADVPALAQLRAVLPEALPPIRVPIRESGLFGGEKEAWQCECGKKPKADDAWCPGCERDRHGFRRAQGSLEGALAALDARLDVLRARFAPAASADDPTIALPSAE